MGLRVLITNVTLWPRSGTALYVRDLAFELQRLGHAPAVFSSTAGEIAAELRAAGILVSDRLRDVPQPDIIHGHHDAPTLLAVRRWPLVPAIHLCHDHQSPQDRTPIHPRIRRHFGVSRLCVERIVADGVTPAAVSLLPNFVDTTRFAARPPLPERPRRALVFSNYAGRRSHLTAVSDACREAGVELDVAGIGVGRPVSEPERLLPQYDIVFAKAKSAMEAMAVGNAVILCDFGGVGPMVTSANFEELRPLNFGFEALREPLVPQPLLREIARYDRHDAALVRDLLRSRAALSATVSTLVAIYGQVIADHVSDPLTYGPPPLVRLIRASLFLRLYWVWVSFPQRPKETIKNLPGMQYVRAALRRIG